MFRAAVRIGRTCQRSAVDITRKLDRPIRKSRCLDSISQRSYLSVSFLFTTAFSLASLWILSLFFVTIAKTLSELIHDDMYCFEYREE